MPPEDAVRNGLQGFAVGVDVGLRATNCPNGVEVRTFDADGFLVDNETFVAVN